MNENRVPTFQSVVALASCANFTLAMAKALSEFLSAHPFPIVVSSTETFNITVDIVVKCLSFRLASKTRRTSDVMHAAGLRDLPSGGLFHQVCSRLNLVMSSIITGDDEFVKMRDHRQQQVALVQGWLSKTSLKDVLGAEAAEMVLVEDGSVFDDHRDNFLTAHYCVKAGFDLEKTVLFSVPFGEYLIKDEELAKKPNLTASQFMCGFLKSHHIIYPVVAPPPERCAGP